MYKHGQDCPICGIGKLKKKVINETFEYKGHTHIVPNYVVYECPACEEYLVDKKSVKESQKIIKDFFREVDGLLSSADIKRIRKKLGYTQEEIAKELGVGLKNFARYENGQVVQGRAMDLLLRTFDMFPEILAWLKHQERRYQLKDRNVFSAEGTIDSEEGLTKDVDTMAAVG